jgi:hypothetical protein
MTLITLIFSHLNILDILNILESSHDLTIFDNYNTKIQ